MDLIIQPRLKPTCARCGENLTAPIEYNGGLYGWTCIKIVNPLAKKPKSKQVWVLADSYNDEITETGNTKRIAFFKGKKFSDFVQKGSPYPFKHIVVNSGNAFINAISYGSKLINLL